MDNSTVTIGDLTILRNAIDVAASRGAFRAAELSSVGGAFDKLNKFLEEISAQAKATEEASTEESPEGENSAAEE